MSQDIICTIIRDGTMITPQPFGPVQLDRAGLMEASQYSAPPYFVHDAYLWPPVPLRQNDYLKDMNNIDYVSNTNVIYHVANLPEVFPDGHTECVAILTRLPTT